MREDSGTLSPDLNATKPLGEYLGWNTTIEMHVTHDVGQAEALRYDCTFHANYSFQDAWKFIVGHVESKRETDEIPICPHMTLVVTEAKRLVELNHARAQLWLTLVHEHLDGSCMMGEEGSK